MTSQRLDKTRDAFQAGDSLRSALVHDSTAAAHVEPTLSGGRFMKPLVFGGLDGISTIFSLIAGSRGAQLSLPHMLAVGAGNLIAGAFGMGFGEYVSSTADAEVARREQAREHWEVENYPQGEINEMIEIYCSKGIALVDAQIVANTLSKYKEFWVEHMMLTEIGMLPSDPSESHALSGLIMFAAFFVFGAIPLVSYAAIAILQIQVPPFVACAGVSLVTLFTLGALKAHVLSQPKLSGGAVMTLQGSLCAASAYWLGDLIQSSLVD
jgi:VIT1/CCC1 family predicted Fe2+/Mn2+ transporter